MSVATASQASLVSSKSAVPEEKPAPTEKAKVPQAACFTFHFNAERTHALGIALHSDNSFQVDGAKIAPAKNLISPIITSLGQRRILSHCGMKETVAPGAKPGIFVLLDSSISKWPMSVRCPLPRERWKEWCAAERLPDAEKKRSVKNDLRTRYPDNFEIRTSGAAIVAPNERGFRNFNLALLKIDEGGSIEVNAHSQDRGPNCYLLECRDGKLVVTDPRKSAIEETDSVIG